MDTEYLEMESPPLQVATKDKIEYEQASQNNSSTNIPNNERLPSPVGGQSLNLDTVIQAQNSLMRCHNCLIRIKKLKRYNLQDPDILSVIQRWSHPRKVSITYFKNRLQIISYLSLSAAYVNLIKN